MANNVIVLPFSTVSGTGSPIQANATAKNIHAFTASTTQYDIPVVYAYNNDSAAANFRITHSGSGVRTDLTTGSIASKTGAELLLPGQCPFRGGELMVSGSGDIYFFGNITRQDTN